MVVKEGDLPNYSPKTWGLIAAISMNNNAEINNWYFNLKVLEIFGINEDL